MTIVTAPTSGRTKGEVTPVVAPLVATTSPISPPAAERHNAVRRASVRGTFNPRAVANVRVSLLANDARMSAAIGAR